MIEISREADVPGKPDQVAGLVSDLERWPEWFALHKGWVGEVPDEAAVGVRFRHKVRLLGVPGEVTWEVVELEPPSRFVLEGKGSSRTSMKVDFRIAAAETGSRVAFTAELGGLALRPFKGQVEDFLVVRAERSLAALTDLLSGETGERG